MKQRNLAACARNLVTLVVLAIFLPGCQDPLSPPLANDAPVAPRGTGLAVVRIGGAEGARTIMPSAPEFSRYELTFTGADGTAGPEPQADGLKDGAVPVELAPGSWTATVKAYQTIAIAGEGRTYQAAQGSSAPFEVSAGQVIPVAVPISPLAIDADDGSGNPLKGFFSFDITLPVGVTTAALSLDGGAGIDLTNTLSGSQELDAGVHELLITLAKDGLSTGLYELVHIYPGLESEAFLNLSDIEFSETVFLAGTADASLPAGVSLPYTVSAYSDAAYQTPITGTGTAAVTVDGGPWLLKIPVSYIGQNVYLKAEAAGLTEGYAVAPGKAEVRALPAKGQAGIALSIMVTSGGAPPGPSGPLGPDEEGLEADGTKVAINAPFTYAKAAAWMRENAVSNGTYRIQMNNDATETITAANAVLFPSGATGVTVTLQGLGSAGRVIKLTGTGSLVSLPIGVNFTLDGSIVLEGDNYTTNDNSLVRVGPGSTLEMTGSSKVTGNNAYNSNGGGVYVDNGGSFTMSGNAAITENKAFIGGGVFVSGNMDNHGTFTMRGGSINFNTGMGSGGGVHVYSYGEFTMEDGAITLNEARGADESGDNNGGGNGGGVFVHGSSLFTMKGGDISANKAAIAGGGVFAEGGTFDMEGGSVSGNTATGKDSQDAGNGGGVFVSIQSRFTMSGGADITSNIATRGGGVFISGQSSSSHGTFIMKGGSVSKNSVFGYYGGGVYVHSYSEFTMEAGSISENRVLSDISYYSGGGGVYVYYGGTFTMQSGSISGNTVTEPFPLSSSGGYNGGGGVYVYSSGTFAMQNGSISNNSVESTVDYSGGGGVYVYGGTFTMSGSNAAISGNTASNTGSGTGSQSFGGGVYFGGGTFTMSGSSAVIRSNTTSGNGGGVYVGGGTFTMSGSNAAISDNTANGTGSQIGGGGVYVSRGTFNMESGSVSGNTAGSTGGGVAVYEEALFYTSAAFIKTGGTLYGSDGDSSSNTVSAGDTWGHAVLYHGNRSLLGLSYSYYRDTTLYAGDNISTKDTLPSSSGSTLNNWTMK